MPALILWLVVHFKGKVGACNPKNEVLDVLGVQETLVMPSLYCVEASKVSALIGKCYKAEQPDQF